MLTARSNGLVLWFNASAALSVLFLASGCLSARYLPQAAAGQTSLMLSGRAISDVIADPWTPSDTRRALEEVGPALEWAKDNGLRVRKNYRRYVDLRRDHVVWFVTSSKPLAFEPRRYWFPVAGSFVGLGWFKERRAERFAENMKRRGWDTAISGASAYSTAGWFRDPLVSSMLGDGDAALGALVDVLLHESVHATVFIQHQHYYDESLASFVADTMTGEYLEERYGRSSPERRSFLEWLSARRHIERRFVEAYDELAKLYASGMPDGEKRRQKAIVMSRLRAELALDEVPNNATLVDAKLYGTGVREFEALLESCGRDWVRFLAAVKSPGEAIFGERQLEDVRPVIRALTERRCVPFPS